LHTGKLRPANPADRISKLVAVGPATRIDCPLWLAFLEESTGKDAELIGFLKRWCGYCLTGDIREHALVFVYGPGGNGKTTFLNTISGILHDYAKTAAMETFTAADFASHPTDLAMLCGARLVTAAETEEGRAWAETRIKQLTGGDPISARFMRCDFFTYQPSFKLMVIGNHEPALRNVDDAARRRFNVIPFIRKPAVVDKQLEDKLKPEWPGILRWMIEGCLEWKEKGLAAPETVLAATASYFDNQDLFSQWLEEKCDAEPGNEHKQPRQICSPLGPHTPRLPAILPEPVKHSLACWSAAGSNPAANMGGSAHGVASGSRPTNGPTHTAQEIDRPERAEQ
jgi:putative DNA primase/helicase